MSNLFTFVGKYYPFIFFIIIIVLSYFLYQEHDIRMQEKAEAEYIQQLKEQNFRAFKDSLNIEYVKKLDAWEITKDNFVVGKLKELEIYNKNLYEELNKLKGEVIAAIRTNVQGDLGGISTTGDKLEILDQKSNFYGIKFNEEYIDNGFEQKIVGTSKFHAIPDEVSKKWLITPDVTTFDTLRTKLKITYGFKQVDNKYKVFAISGSDKVKFNDLTGGYVVDNTLNPTEPAKRWGFGPYVGYGASAGTNLPARFSWSIGFAVHYDILHFNFPKIGK